MSKQLIKTLQDLRRNTYTCPECKSGNVRYFFVDEDLNEIQPNTNELSQQGQCNDCGHSNELHYFKN